MNKIEEFNKWLDEQEIYHRKRSKDIKETVHADAMKQIKNFIANKGWEYTKQYVHDNWLKGMRSNMVGPVALSNTYKKIHQKMWGLDHKESKEENKKC